MLPVAGPVAVSRSRCSGILPLIASGLTASLDAVSAVAADCALSVTAAASPSLDAVSALAADCALSVTAAASSDAAAGAFGAVSAGPVGEAAGGGAPPAVLAASVSKGAGARCAV